MTLKILWTLLLFLLELATTNWNDYPAIQDCKSRAILDTEFIALSCSLRTINSDIDTTDFSVIPPHNTVSLTLKCNDSLLFQSFLCERSFQHLRKLKTLEIHYCKIGDISKETFAGLRQLVNLTLKTFNSEWTAISLNISENSFHDQISLKMLHMTDSNILAIPKKLFCGLGNLTYLNLSRNKLQEINNLGFEMNSQKCATKLRLLDLSYNVIHNVPAFSFIALKNLTLLNMSNNNIVKVADQAFFGMYSLEKLDLSSNLITTLPPELFKENKRLIYFSSKNNSISVLAPGLLFRLDMLLKLDLSSNRLTNTWVNSETFIGLLRLASLDLSSNYLTRLDAATYRDLTNLQTLNLRNNQINHISKFTFKELFRLHTLILSENKIQSLSENIFSGLIMLDSLNLSNNNISYIHENVLQHSTRLNALYLTNSSLEHVPPLFYQLGSLTYLELGYNRIKSFSNNTLVGLSSLSTLILRFNLLESINKYTFYQIPMLEVLDCSNNLIKIIENGAFNYNRKLVAVRLDNNSIKNIHGLFSDLSLLKWLNVSKNSLEMFDYAFIPRQLEYLDLKNNLLNEIGNHFKIESLLKLKVLDVSFNKIRTLSATSVADSLEVILLNNNLISNVHPYSFFKNVNLTRVDLVRNEIRKLYQNALRLSVIKPGSQVPEFHLSENPFECDCTFEWLQTINIQEISHNTPRVVDLTSIMCHLFNKRGESVVPLLEAQKLQFLCQYTFHCSSMCHCCDFDACDCEMTCPERCTCFHDESWTVNLVDCSNIGLQKVPERIPMDSSEVYLDGNELYSLSSHMFIGRKNLRILYLNSSNIQEIHNQTFSGTNRVKILYLNNNHLVSLRGYEFSNLRLLKELYLHNNFLKFINITTFQSLNSLKILRIDGNYLTIMPSKHFTENLLLKQLWLSNNPWRCNCSLLRDIKAIKHSSFLGEMDKFYCVDENKNNFNISSFNHTCSSRILTTVFSPLGSQDFLHATVTLGLCAFFLTVMLVLFYCRNRMKVWMYARYGLRLFHARECKSDKNKVFDAFISYSSKDEVFVTQILAPELERGSSSFNLCLHYRDFPLSNYINDNIFAAIQSSRRIILVISENFLKYEWSRFDFRSAHHEIFCDRRKRLIVVLLGEISEKDLDTDLLLYLKTNTYLKWGDNRFWEKLKYAMPNVKSNSSSLPLQTFSTVTSQTETHQDGVSINSLPLRNQVACCHSDLSLHSSSNSCHYQHSYVHHCNHYN